MWITLNHCQCWLLQPSNWKPLWRPSELARRFQDHCNLQSWHLHFYSLIERRFICLVLRIFLLLRSLMSLQWDFPSAPEPTWKDLAALCKYWVELSLGDSWIMLNHVESCWIMLNHAESSQTLSNHVESEHLVFKTPTSLGLLHASQVELELLDHAQQLPPVAALCAKFQRHWACSRGVLATNTKERLDTWHQHGTMITMVEEWQLCTQARAWKAVLANDPEQKLCLWIHSCNLSQLHVIVKWHEANASLSGDAGIPAFHSIPNIDKARTPPRVCTNKKCMDHDFYEAYLRFYSLAPNTRLGQSSQLLNG